MLSRQPYSWPLTGGITSKQSPLISDPSSYTTLNNVRMERLNEWRARGGYTAAAADTLPSSNPAVRSIGLPGGGLFGLCSQPDGASACRIYSPSLTTRWSQPTTNQCSQSGPVSWTRAPITGGVETASSVPPDSVTMATGGGYMVTAWGPVGVGATVLVTSDVDGTAVTEPLFLGTGKDWPRCVYAQAANKLCVFVKDSTTGAVSMWSWVAGVLTDVGVAVVAGCDPFGPLDADYYGGAAVSLVARTAAGSQVKYFEFNPSTLTATTNLNLAVTDDNSSFCLALFGVDSGGNRHIVVSNSTPETRVVRVTSGGAIVSNVVAFAATTGVATGLVYSQGWMLVYESGSSLSAVKTFVGSAGTPVSLGSAPATGSFRLHSKAWHAPTQTSDTMRFIYAIHTADQNSYYEMALEYNTGDTVIANRFKEPQARLAALSATTTGASFGLSQPVVTVSSRSASMALVRETHFSIPGDAAGASKLTFAVDRWTASYLDTTGANLLPANMGPGVTTAGAAFLPSGTLLHTSAGSVAASLGCSSLPSPLALTQSTVGGAGLTTTSTYGYVVTVDMYDDAGNVCHGPPTVTATILLTGTNNKVTVTFSCSQFENPDRKRTVKIWRTKGNGSVFQLVHSVTDTIANTLSFAFADTTTDAALLSSDFLPLDLPSMLTPSVNHVAYFNGRMWASDREQPGVLWFTKPIQVGELPHFVFEFSVNIDAGTGPCTGLAAMDDKLVVFKKAAIYIVAGDGPDNNGGGQFPSVFKPDSDVGNLPGSPAPTTGSEVFFVSVRGIHRINKSLQIDFVGADVDQFLNQPLVGITDTVVAAVFVPSVNEVRFECTSQRLVYDRLHNFWVRDTGNSAGSLGVSATQSLVLSTGKHAILMSNATMYVEGGPLTADDGGVPYICTIRSAWMRPAGVDGYMRLYKARILGVRTSPGGFPPSDAITPSLTIFYDNDDTLFETKFPQAALAGSAPTVRALAIPRRQKCSTFSLQVTIPTVGASGVDSVADLTFRLEQWAVEIGLKPGMQRNGTAERWT